MNSVLRPNLHLGQQFMSQNIIFRKSSIYIVPWDKLQTIIAFILYTNTHTVVVSLNIDPFLSLSLPLLYISLLNTNKIHFCGGNWTLLRVIPIYILYALLWIQLSTQYEHLYFVKKGMMRLH